MVLRRGIGAHGGTSMHNQELVLVTREGQLPEIVTASGRKARDRVEHFLFASIDNANTRKAYGRALASFFTFLEDGGRGRVQDIGPLDVRDYLDEHAARP